jgi:hypothetical protein
MPVHSIRIVDFQELRELEGDWKSDDLVAVLATLGIEDAGEFSPEEIREMCVLSLQDLDSAEAAAVLMQYKMGEALTPGQIQNLSHDCQTEKLWEHGGDMELHRGMFSVGSLLAVVNEQQFPTPDAVRVTLELECPSAEEFERMTDEPTPVDVVRMLAAGMPHDAILNRLFEDALTSGTFPEAASILWDLEIEPIGQRTAMFKIISSGNWFDPLRETESFTWNGSNTAA